MLCYCTLRHLYALNTDHLFETNRAVVYHCFISPTASNIKHARIKHASTLIRWEKKMKHHRTEHNLYSTRLDNSTDNSTDGLTIRLAIHLYNSADNPALQFILSISSDEFVLTIRLTIGLTILVDQNGWNDPNSDSTVIQSGCLVPRPSLADVSRIGRSNGKGNPWQGQFFWWYFLVDRFPIMDLSPGSNPATLNRNSETAWCRWFYTYSRRFTHVYLRVRVYLHVRAMHFYSRDNFANFLRLKVLNF